ncbi:MAG: L-fucose:H+ symporter permease [Saprospirales bacterium]|jgi:FHS family L-fucose permease-like MFS transporter|nr:L-fucose:H+ symporter permease [Saprospirales bacterium]MBK8921497.1 L-fucose:H+ symporter permease [Saprospirales bacterium]
MNQTPTRNPYLIPFALVCSLFFLWGIANSLNGSLIRHFQFALDLNRFQAGLVDSAFYLGYFVFAIPAGIFMRKFGYKRGILAGLLLYAGGALLFYPAADIRIYAFFLFALFTIASGLAFLETAANLYVTVLGDEKEAEWRINFAQSFNGISIILGPVIGSLFIFSKKEYTADVLGGMAPEQIDAARIQEALSVQGPYLVVAGVVLLVALLFWLTKMPEVGREEELAEGRVSILAPLRKYRHLVLGVIAQFANVGAQATLWGYFVDFKIDFAKNEHVGFVNTLYRVTEGMTPDQIAGFHASFALVLFMLGRFLGTYLMSRMEPRKVLAYYCMAAVGLVALAFLTGGLPGIICIMLTYFCQSIMFPTIFALATKGMPPAEQKLASSLVIMAIVGGAVMPPVAGLLSGAGGMEMALLVPFVCFSYVVFYVLRGYRIEVER